ncbi:MAG: hypothetical protein ABIQ95_10250 [Bdellovibrionia bacterium]
MKIDIKYASGFIFIFTLVALFSEQQSWSGVHEKEKKVRKKPYEQQQTHNRQRRHAMIPGNQTSKNIQEADLNHKLGGMNLTSPSLPPK